MAPGGKGAVAQDAKPAAAWSIFKPVTWQSTRKVQVAHEGKDMQMYFHPELKKWVERGKEHEVSQDPGSAPPPTALAALPSCPSGTQRERSRKGVSQRYAMQSNLSVSMDTDSFSRCSSSAMLPPLLTSITPPASTNNFFIPAPPASSGGAPASPHAASSLDVTAPPPAVFFMPAPAPAPTDTLQQQEAPALEPAETVELPATTTMPVPGACPQQLLSNSDNCTQGLPPPPPALATAKAPSSAASDAGSELGSKSLHNGHRFSIPRPDALAHWGMTGCWPSGPSSVCDSMSSRDQDPLGLELDAFDAAMHPRRAGKLDGPLPWELPGQLRYSEDFVSICTAWQRRNPGRLYNPKLLMPPSAQQPMSKVCDVDADPDVDDGQRCASEVVSYLQQVAAGLKARRDLPDAEIQRAVALLTSLVGGKAPPAAGTAADKLDTPTRTKVSPAADDAQRLQTPQRSSMMPARVLESSPEAAMVLSRPAASHLAPPKPAPAPGLSAQQMTRLKQELQVDYEQKLTARTAELEARFEARLCDMRRELEEEYERRLSERDVELQAQRQRCEELQDDLDNLLLCLGQESRKVTDLCQAMADAGLDGSTITMSIEEEYALMDLPISAH